MAPFKRHAYNAEFKLKTISYAVKHGNRATAREFNINESMVRNWRKQQDELRRVKKTRKSFRGNKPRWPQLEDKLEQWVVEQRAARRSVSSVKIRMKAAVFARELNISEFRGGPSWCFRFMKRRNISIRTPTTVSQQLPQDYQNKLPTFRAHCKTKITEKQIRPERIINMDEVPPTLDIPVNRTVDNTGASSVNVRTTGNEKSSFTPTSLESTSTSLESKSTSLELKMSAYKKQMEMLIEYLSTGQYPPGLDKAQKRNIRNQTKNHFLDSNNQLMYRKTATLSLKVVVCPDEVKDILRQYHGSAMGGHSGINTTMGKIIQLYWWQAMKADVIEYVSTCPKCQTYKKLKSQTPALKCITANEPLELVGMDLMGPYPETPRGHRYILTFTDYFTKFVDFFPLSAKSAQGVAEGIKTFVCQRGTPARLLSDQSREFVAEVNTAVCAEFGINRSITSAYHLQSSGLNERTNQSLKVQLSKLVNDQQNNWDDYLDILVPLTDEDDDEKPVTWTLNTSDTSTHNETSCSSDVSTLSPPSPARTSTQPLQRKKRKRCQESDPVHAAQQHKQTKLNMYNSFTNYLNTVLQELPEADANKLMKDIHRQMASYM